MTRGRWAGVLALTALLLAAGAWWATGTHTDTRAQADRLACALPVSATAASAPQPGLVWVPPGSFELGDTVYPEESPLQRRSVAGFWMDRTEVTNDEFAAFVTWPSALSTR